MNPITARPSFLILTIKEEGEQIVLRTQGGMEIASIVARPHRGRVKVGVSAGPHIVITREERKTGNPPQLTANAVLTADNEKSRTSPRQGRGKVWSPIRKKAGHVLGRGGERSVADAMSDTERTVSDDEHIR